VHVPTLEDLRAAEERIRGRAHRTPVLTCSAVDARAGAEVFFKCESFQKVGAFKFRGACNAVFALDDETATRGVGTHSSGNHGQAVALAARMRGIQAHIVMPSNAPKAKRAAVAGYGARIVTCEPTLEARETTLAEVVRETGCHEVHPYDDPFVVAGQATATMELLEEVPDLDAILVPVGGGGLASGACLATRYLAPAVEVHGAEPELANDAAEGIAKGERLPPKPPVTVADGLRTALGPLSFGVLSENVKVIHVVSEGEIVDAMRFVWGRMKIVVEASSAVPVAVAMRRALEGKRVGLLVSGGNLDLDRLPWQDEA